MDNEIPLILIAEDDDDLRFLTTRQIKKLGFASHYATTGKEAVEMAEKHQYDIILMDVMMPGMDGYTASRMIRQLEKQLAKTRVPIIAMTALQFSEECQKADMDDYLFKPVVLGELETKLRRWLKTTG